MCEQAGTSSVRVLVYSRMPKVCFTSVLRANLMGTQRSSTSRKREKLRYSVTIEFENFRNPTNRDRELFVRVNLHLVDIDYDTAIYIVRDIYSVILQ